MVVPLSCNNSGHVVHTHVPLLPSSIIWYLPMGGDALQLGRANSNDSLPLGIYRRLRIQVVYVDFCGIFFILPSYYVTYYRRFGIFMV